MCENAKEKHDTYCSSIEFHGGDNVESADLGGEDSKAF
jgi:hypothetical protein